LIGKLIGLILPLGLDTFAVAAALGAVGAQQRFRISALLSSFEAGMPLIGLALGAPLGRAIGRTADYVAIGVLLAFGVYTLLGREEADEERLAQFASLRGPAALLLGVSVSLDELAIGFTLGLLRLPVGLVIALIALQAFVLAQLGLRLGGRLSARYREGAERLAGIALAGLAVALLVQKLV
jgi:manganese efflux pump family protein